MNLLLLVIKVGSNLVHWDKIGSYSKLQLCYQGSSVVERRLESVDVKVGQSETIDIQATNRPYRP